MAEDRLWFKDAMLQIGLDVPKSVLANKVETALKFSRQVGFPADYPALVHPGRHGARAWPTTLRSWKRKCATAWI